DPASEFPPAFLPSRPCDCQTDLEQSKCLCYLKPHVRSILSPCSDWVRSPYLPLSNRIFPSGRSSSWDSGTLVHGYMPYTTPMANASLSLPGYRHTNPEADTRTGANNKQYRGMPALQ